ncbi:MAG: ribonuclease HII [Euryarchaeota archaeon]|nr:ribonuclease HII [Euryarchaeota archaeon]|tara:strand:- start:1214 stop:1951 length:738 start_codon:yes stop_codon:yes gene_type:complete
MMLAGIDEAGRGPCLGPLVVGGFALPEEDIILLAEFGINDSKLLSNKKREACFNWLNEQAEERDWRIRKLLAFPAHIDNWMTNRSLNDLEVEMFAHISNELISSEVPNKGRLHLDACDVNEERFGDNVASRLKNWPWDGWDVKSEHGADEKHLVVGAASIIAKQTREIFIHEMSEKEAIDFGSGYPSDPKTREILPTLVSGNSPHEMLRWCWKTTKRAWGEAHESEIPIRPRVEPLLPETNLFDF